jgi:hypothetical protein
MPAPTVIAVEPSMGPAGTTVTIIGSGFSGATSVEFGYTAAAVVGGGDTEIITIAPGGEGTVSVTVVTPTGSSISSGRFTYTS